MNHTRAKNISQLSISNYEVCTLLCIYIYFTFHWLVFSNSDVGMSNVVMVLTLTIITIINERFLSYFSKVVLIFSVISVVVCFTVLLVEIIIGYRLVNVLENSGDLIRFKFIFSEPSHFSIFLALILSSINFNRQLSLAVILSVTLLFTWSLSGFLLLFFNLLVRILSRRGTSKNVVVIILLVTLVFYLTTFIKSGFISYKINSLLTVMLNGEFDSNSASIRLISSLSALFFILDYKESINVFLGLGFYDGGIWFDRLFYMYTNSVGFKFSNNLIANCIVYFGLLGFTTLILAFISASRNIKVGMLVTLIYLLPLSFFSGYLYGPIALLFYIQILIIPYLTKSSENE